MKRFMVVVTSVLLLGLSTAKLGQAQMNLENPPPGVVSFQSGVGIVSGWVCSATGIDIIFDNTTTLQAPYGSSRGDTQSVCGDTDNGFGLLVNWDLLGEGTHTVQAARNGVVFASATVVVHTFGPEFLLRGKTDICRLPQVPVQTQDTFVQWQQGLQNFVIVDVRPHDPQFPGPECGEEE